MIERENGRTGMPPSRFCLHTEPCRYFVDPMSGRVLMSGRETGVGRDGRQTNPRVERPHGSNLLSDLVSGWQSFAHRRI
eukprot:2336445-Rhodomonas_salina.1